MFISHIHSHILSESLEIVVDSPRSKILDGPENDNQLAFIRSFAGWFVFCLFRNVTVLGGSAAGLVQKEAISNR